MALATIQVSKQTPRAKLSDLLVKQGHDDATVVLVNEQLGALRNVAGQTNFANSKMMQERTLLQCHGMIGRLEDFDANAMIGVEEILTHGGCGESTCAGCYNKTGC